MESGDATRRTRLAGERTQLAWWRTGLTSLAVGIAIGRVVPELNESIDELAYVAVGVGFGLYGVLLFAYGNMRGRALEDAVSHGGFAQFGRHANLALAAGGIVLGVATCFLILLG